MQKYDKLTKILSVLVITSAALYIIYKTSGQSEGVFGYDHLIGLSLPNALVSINENLIHDVNLNENVDKDVNILVKEAQDNAGQQLKDIIDLEEHGIDLLIISPIHDAAVFEKIQSMEIPVIVLNERAAMDYADSFIRYDNWGAGELMARHISSAKASEASILLLSGNEIESVSKEREEGFIFNLPKALRDRTEKIYCNWSRNEAQNKMKAYLVSGKQATIVVALSDQMSYGAYLSTDKLRVHDVRFYGMNGFEGDDNGLDLVRNNILDNSVKFENMYEAMMKVALEILKGIPHEKEVILKAELVR